jgi:hypothetical protein
VVGADLRPDNVGSNLAENVKPNTINSAENKKILSIYQSADLSLSTHEICKV